MKKKTATEIFLSSLIFIPLITILFLALALDILLEDSPGGNAPIHHCELYEEYEERYMVTPFLYRYRKSFRCVECKKPYKEGNK